MAELNISEAGAVQFPMVRHAAPKSAVVLRQHQSRAIDRIVERCAEPSKRRGFIWHTQGCGKTFTLLTAAREALSLVRDRVRGDLETDRQLVLPLVKDAEFVGEYGL